MEEDMSNRENEVSWIYQGRWHCKNKVTRKISVLGQIKNVCFWSPYDLK